MVKVDVTDYDIEHGRSSLYDCPIARAITRLLKPEYQCAVGAHTRIILQKDASAPIAHWQYKWITTKEQFTFMRDFDGAGRVTPNTPREFIFDIPSEYLK